MIVKIKTDDNGRVTGWCVNGGMGGEEIEAEKPPANYADYRYEEGQYVYDPLPAVNEPEEVFITNEDLADAVTELADMVSTLEDAIVELAGMMEGSAE